jgi:hypothetical protein
MERKRLHRDHETECEESPTVLTRPANRVTRDLQRRFGNGEIFGALREPDACGLAGFLGQELCLGLSDIGGAKTMGNSAMQAVLHRQANGSNELDAETAEKNIQASAGRPLPKAIRARMEQVLGTDFGHVRIHTDSSAARAAQAAQAQAFATGSQIFFAQGKFEPGSSAGVQLLAHELVHVIQEDEARLPGPTSGGLSVSNPGEAHEREAEAISEQALQALKTSQAPTEEAPTPLWTRTSGPSSTLHRTPDESVSIATYGETGEPLWSESLRLQELIGDDLWSVFDELERRYLVRVIPCLNHAQEEVRDAALDAEELCISCFVWADDYLETEEVTRLDLFEEDLLDAWLGIERMDAIALWHSIRLHSGLMGLMSHWRLAESIGIIRQHQERLSQAMEELEAVQRAIESFVADVVKGTLAGEAKGKVLKTIATGWLVALAPTTAAGAATLVLISWLAEELIGLAVAGGEPTDNGSLYMAGQAATLTELPVGTKKLLAKSAELSDAWKVLDQVNKHTGRILKALNWSDVAFTRLTEINDQIDAVSQRRLEIEADFPRVQEISEDLYTESVDFLQLAGQDLQIQDQLLVEKTEIEDELDWLYD